MKNPNYAWICLTMVLWASRLSQAAEPAPAGGGPRGPVNSNDLFYLLGPDSKPMDGVPKGKFTEAKVIPSKVFPGTQHTYWVYVPAQYDPARPTAVMVFNDGQAMMAEPGDVQARHVLDNLIFRREIPVMLGVFINPGRRPEQPEPTPRDWGDRTSNRPDEYNPPTDQYARVIVEELMPALKKEFNISPDPDLRGIMGASSGGCAAFSVAWFRPNDFRKVITFVGSFTSIRGEYIYPELVAESERKPIRVFMQDGRNDNRRPDNPNGDWFYQNVRLMRALTQKGYEVNYTWGIGNHGQKQGGAVFPEMMRWLWRDQPVSTDPNDDVERMFRVPVAPVSETTGNQAASMTNGLSATDFVPPGVHATNPATVHAAPYSPIAILQGGIVVALYPPGSPYLKMERAAEAEQYNTNRDVPGRINSIVNIHNPSIEAHPVDGGLNTGAAIILAPGGGDNTLNVGTQGTDFVRYFFNYGVNTFILRNRLRSDGYDPKTDAVNDALQAIRLVRGRAKEWRLDPNKIGIMGFSAGAELAAATAVFFGDFDKKNSEPGDPLASVSSRPDFVGLVYPGPSPFARGASPPILTNAPPAFIVCAGSGDRVHAIWADEYFRAMLNAGVPNVETHIYGNGRHPGDALSDGSHMSGGLTYRNGIPFGTWQDRFIDWFRDLGFLQKAGLETKAAQNIKSFSKQP